MKAMSCVQRGNQLSDSKVYFHNQTRQSLSATLVAGISGAMMLWLTGCASDPAGRVSASAPSGLPDQVRLNLGTIGIAEDTSPAAVGFASGTGALETAGDRSSRFAGTTINRAPGIPEGDLLISPITFVATPFAALAGAVAPGRHMNANQMMTAQLDVTAALERASRQEPFRVEIIRAAKETGGRELVSVGQARGDPGRADTILQTRIEQVSLERLTGSESSFALKIKTRNRLIRASDGVVLCDRPMEYCSGTDLFVDWTRAGAIDSVMQTGLRKIARDLTTEMLSLYDTPILAGAARPTSGSKPALPLTPVKLAGLTHGSSPGLIQVADTGSAAIGIFATSHVARVSVQHIVDSQPELPVSVQQTEWMLDGLDKHPNYGVSLIASVVALPISLWNQGVEVVMRPSSGKVRESSESLRRAAQALQMDEQVAFEVAQSLAPRTEQRVALVSGPLPSPEAFLALEPATGSPRVQFVSRRAPGTRLAGVAIQIHITRAALSGKGEFNPLLSLNVQGEADLVRLSDGAKLCSFPMEYRSETHRYTQWAARDADLFRKELKRAHSELGKALADHLVTRGIVPPERSKSPLLANN